MYIYIYISVISIFLFLAVNPCESHVCILRKSMQELLSMSEKIPRDFQTIPATAIQVSLVFVKGFFIVHPHKRADHSKISALFR